MVVIFGTACNAGCFGVIRSLNPDRRQTGRIFRIAAENLTFWSMNWWASAFVRECDAPQKGCLMRFVRLGLAFYAAALLSGCQSLRRQPPAAFEDVRIPPVREGEYAAERPRPHRNNAAEVESEEPAPRGPIKSIAWLRPGNRSEKLAPQSKSRQIPAQTVSNPLTDRMRRLFRFSREAECSENCDGNPALMLDSPGAMSEPALLPRGPASVRADYGNGSPPANAVPVPENAPAPIRRPTPTRPGVPVELVEPDKTPTAADNTTVPAEPPEVPPVFIPPAKPQRLQGDGSPSDNDPSRPSLPPVLVEDPPMPVPSLPAVPDVPADPGSAPPVPDAPVFPEPPTFPPGAETEAPAEPGSPAASKSSKSSGKTKSKSTTPRKSTTAPRSTEEDAVLEERLRQSAERMRANGSKPSGSGTSAAPRGNTDAAENPADPPLWPKRFGGSPPVGEPVLDPPAAPVTGDRPAAPRTRSGPAPATSPAPLPAPLPAPVPMPAPPAPMPELPADTPPAIPGLSPTIDLDSEIPRPPRTPPASPAPTSFRPRSGRSL